MYKVMDALKWQTRDPSFWSTHLHYSRQPLEEETDATLCPLQGVWLQRVNACWNLNGGWWCILGMNRPTYLGKDDLLATSQSWTKAWSFEPWRRKNPFGWQIHAIAILLPRDIERAMMSRFVSLSIAGAVPPTAPGVL